MVVEVDEETAHARAAAACMRVSADGLMCARLGWLPQQVEVLSNVGVKVPFRLTVTGSNYLELDSSWNWDASLSGDVINGIVSQVRARACACMCMHMRTREQRRPLHALVIPSGAPDTTAAALGRGLPAAKEAQLASAHDVCVHALHVGGRQWQMLGQLSGAMHSLHGSMTG